MAALAATNPNWERVWSTMASLLLWLDIPFHLWCLPVCPGVTTTTSTSDLPTTDLSGQLDNGSMKHGPLRFHSPRYLRDVVETLLEVGVEDVFQRLLGSLGYPNLSTKVRGQSFWSCEFFLAGITEPSQKLQSLYHSTNVLALYLKRFNNFNSAKKQQQSLSLERILTKHYTAAITTMSEWLSFMKWRNAELKAICVDGVFSFGERWSIVCLRKTERGTTGV